MANLSQEKRARMLAFLQQIRAEHTDDTSIIAINEIENELTSKKYGLVWEEHTEEVDEQMKHNVPVFTEVSDKTITTDGTLPYNFLLEGDNLHSLKLLEKTHKGKIDVIYIDPPYNTGNKDFLYDDDIVAEDDGFRHSKWLSFMEKRLLLAKSILSKKGVIFISIDDNEQANLKILCDTIFGESNYVGLLPRITKKSGKDHSVGIAKNHDYVLVYVKDKSVVEFCGIKSSEDSYPLKDEFFEERGGYKLNQTLDYDSLWYNPKMDFPIQVDNEVFYPGGSEELHNQRHRGIHKPKDWVWRWSKEKFDFGLANGFVVIKRSKGRTRIYTKTYSNASISNTKPYTVVYKERETLLSSIALTDNSFSNDNAKKEITKLKLEEFGFPKPSALIHLLITIVKNANIVLDFFAGSGTTGQAVMELNRQDGGNRRFILCTNNENGICENITYQRIKTVITGKRADGTEYGERIPANLKYFKTDFIAKTGEDEAYSVSDKLLEHIPEMVELQYGTRIDNEKHILVLTDEEADGLTEQSLANCEQLYVSVSVLLTAEQEKMFKRMGIEVLLIPDYYFESELLEVGER